ncbi:MAG TPA: PAC2 family protein [Miltoncostaeaceae bacterium]|nr:PAC2 family protein [Miltoncostaeaceae bacterium]
MSQIRWDNRSGDLRDPVLIAAFRGWNDAAAAASGAVTFLAERHNAQRVGFLDPEDFFDFQVTRPLIDLSDAEAPALTWPEIEIAVIRPEGGGRDLVLMAGPEPSMRWRTFSELLLDGAATLGVGLVVTLGSLLADVPHTRPVRLTGMASDASLIAGLGSRPPSYVGPTGITGVMHHMAGARGVPAVSLWAPSSHYAAGLTNAKASLALVRALETVIGVELGAGALQAAALAYEQQVTHAVESDGRLQALVEQLERAADTEPVGDTGPLPSGDDLAAELERYLREYEGGEGS